MTFFILSKDYGCYDGYCFTIVALLKDGATQLKVVDMMDILYHAHVMNIVI